jgi:hypothetical protein
MNQPNISGVVQAGSARTLIVTWTSRVEHTIGLDEIIGRSVVFEPLRTDDAVFQAVPDGNVGGCVQCARSARLTAARALAQTRTVGNHNRGTGVRD